MLPPEIRPRQIRALLLLLVLVPLIPVTLMIRFMFDMAESERDSTRERSAAFYQELLSNAESTLAKQSAAKGFNLTPAEAYEHFRALLGRDVAVRISDEHDATLAGVESKPDAFLARESFSRSSHPWRVELYWTAATGEDPLARERIRSYARTVTLALTAVICIAGAAAWTLHRQLAMRELRSTAVATVAHELRTPLASIRMLVDTLREGRYRSESQHQEYLDLIASELQRLSRITENFLAFSRMERSRHGLRLEPVPPREVAEAAIQTLRPRLDAPGCRFEYLMMEPVPEIQADREAIIGVLTNLLENALKYTDEDKRISLEIEAEDEAVRFDVVDNGIGISRSERRTIFEPFQQLDQRLSRSREGCGLGLSIVRQVVEAHGGRIDVESAPGHGSRFSVRIPQAAPASPYDEKALAKTQRRKGEDAQGKDGVRA